jgi:hypothetical protein
VRAAGVCRGGGADGRRSRVEEDEIREKKEIGNWERKEREGYYSHFISLVRHVKLFF